MKGYLTKNKLINLLCIFPYFSDFHTNNIEYLREKYFKLFHRIPDRLDYNVYVLIHKDILRYDGGYINNKSISDFKKQYDIYKDKWKITSISFSDYIILFTFYYLSNGLLTLKELNKRYSHLFSSYLDINEDPQVNGLHSIWKGQIDRYMKRHKDDILFYDRSSKLLKIKNKIKNGNFSRFINYTK